MKCLTMRSSPITRWLRKWPHWPEDPSKAHLRWKLVHTPFLVSFEDALMEYAGVHSTCWCDLTQQDICDAASWYLGGVFPTGTSVEELWHALPKRKTIRTNITVLMRWLEKFALRTTHTAGSYTLPGFVRAVVSFEDECVAPCGEPRSFALPAFAGALFVLEGPALQQSSSVCAHVSCPARGAHCHDTGTSAAQAAATRPIQLCTDHADTADTPASRTVHAIKDTHTPQQSLASAPVAPPGPSAGERNPARKGWQDGEPIGVHVACSVEHLPGVPASATPGLGTMRAQDLPPPTPPAPRPGAAHAPAAAPGNDEHAAAPRTAALSTLAPAPGPVPSAPCGAPPTTAAAASSAAAAVAVPATGGSHAAPPVHTDEASLMPPSAKVRDDPHEDGQVVCESGCTSTGIVRQPSLPCEAGRQQVLGATLALFVAVCVAAVGHCTGGSERLTGAGTVTADDAKGDEAHASSGSALPPESPHHMLACSKHLLPPPEPPDMGASTPSGPTTAHSNGRAPSQEITAWLLADEDEWVRSEVQYTELSGLPPCSLEQLHAHYETYVRPGRLAFLLPTAEAEHAMKLPALRAPLTEPVQTTCAYPGAGVSLSHCLGKASASRASCCPDFWLPPSEPPDMFVKVRTACIVFFETPAWLGVWCNRPFSGHSEVSKVWPRTRAPQLRGTSVHVRDWWCGSGAVT